MAAASTSVTDAAAAPRPSPVLAASRALASHVRASAEAALSVACLAGPLLGALPLPLLTGRALRGVGRRRGGTPEERASSACLLYMSASCASTAEVGEAERGGRGGRGGGGSAAEAEAGA